MRCDSCGIISNDRDGYYKRGGERGNISSHGRSCDHDFCDRCEMKHAPSWACSKCGAFPDGVKPSRGADRAHSLLFAELGPVRINVLQDDDELRETWTAEMMRGDRTLATASCKETIEDAVGWLKFTNRYVSHDVTVAIAALRIMVGSPSPHRGNRNASSGKSNRSRGKSNRPRGSWSLRNVTDAMLPPRAGSLFIGMDSVHRRIGQGLKMLCRLGFAVMHTPRSSKGNPLGGDEWFEINLEIAVGSPLSVALLDAPL